MYALNSELQVALADALSTLVARLDTLDRRLIAEAGYPQWVWQAPGRLPARDQARAVLRAIEYIDHQDPHETRICPALLGASAETLKAARAVNVAKIELEAALRAIDPVVVMRRDPQTGIETPERLLKVALAEMGCKRLHRRQALRKIVVLDQHPNKVSYTWAQLPKIERTDREAVHAQLQRMFEEGGATLRLVEDLERIDALPAGTPLALVRPPHIHPRANLVYGVRGHASREQCRAVLPILYPAAHDEALPTIRALPDDPPIEPTRARRKTVRVIDAPYLSTLPVHRYRPDGDQGDQRLS